MATTYDEYKKQADQNIAEEEERLKTKGNTLYETQAAAIDKQIAAGQQTYDKQKAEADTQYRDLYDANAVQELIDRNAISERMANLGLSQSGLSATQQTAVALSRGNRDADITRQKQEYMDTIDQAVADMYLQGEGDKTAARIAIDQDIADSLEAYRAAQYGAIGDWAKADNDREVALQKLQAEADEAAKQREFELALAQAKYDAEALQKEAARQQEVLDMVNTNRLALMRDLLDAGYSYDEAADYALKMFPSDGSVNNVAIQPSANTAQNKSSAIETPLGTVGSTAYGPVQMPGLQKTESADAQLKSVDAQLKSGAITNAEAIRAVVYELYPNDTAAQTKALKQLGFADVAISAALDYYSKAPKPVEPESAPKSESQESYESKLNWWQRTSMGVSTPKQAASLLNGMVSTGQLTKGEAAAEILFTLYKDDAAAQKTALTALGYDGDEVDGIMNYIGSR